MSDDLIPWHTAFVEAIQADLADYADVLEFEAEHQLNAEPLRIDVIIKKHKDAVIEKIIGHIFRVFNIVEYKSPTDYLSVADFYKVYSYACLYVGRDKQKRIDIRDITITFVSVRYPREVFEHLRNVRKYKITEIASGVYEVTGDILPIQFIVTKKLSESDGLYLKTLTNRLDVAMLQRFSMEKPKNIALNAFFDVLFRANPKIFEELSKMNNQSLEEYLIEKGYMTKMLERVEKRGEALGEKRGEARGEVRGEARAYKKMGVPVFQIAEKTGLQVEEIERL
jgi:hypothetical protein